MAEDVTNLPKWAQQRIRALEMEREAAIRKLRSFEDSQTPGDIWYEDLVCLGEKKGPSTVHRYIQSNKVSFRVPGGSIEVLLPNAGQRKYLQVCGSDSLVILPYSTNVIEILGVGEPKGEK